MKPTRCCTSVLLLLLATGSYGQTRPAVTPPPADLKLDPFYEKHVDAGGIPVVASAAVPDAALLAARDLAVRMLSKRADVRDELVRRKVRIAVMAESEVTTDVPEHRDLDRAFPATDWDERARGLGATVQRPASSCAEENLLGYAGDRYAGESIFIHEFAHSMLTCGLVHVDGSFRKRLRAAYDEAVTKRLWRSTYAATNADEYWAEGVQSWFDANVGVDPANGVHNGVNTRAELKTYDPALAGLIAEVFADDAWRFTAPNSPAPTAAPAPATRPRNRS